MDEENLREKARIMLEQIGHIISSLRNKKGWTYEELSYRANEALPENSTLVYEPHTILLMESGIEILPDGYTDLEVREVFNIERMNNENAVWPVLEALGVTHLFPLRTKDDIDSDDLALKI